MEAMVAWQQKPNEYETTREAEEMVREVYTDYRNRGWDAPVALEQTAMDFGFTRRRVRSFLEGYVSTVAHEQWREIKRRFLAHLDDEIEFAMKRAADRLARLKVLEVERQELRRRRA